MHRLLERLDGVASTIVPLLYLVGLALGAASYFAGVTLAGANAGLAVGVALATAAELHSFLQQRRVRATWAQLQRLPDDLDHAPERDALTTQLTVNAGILAALLAFSAFNATAFVAATWTPAPGFLPGWLQIGIRGCVIPALFFGAGFLAPLHTDASDQLRATSMAMLRRTLKAIGQQWKQRLAEAQRRKADLAPIAIALLEDIGDLDGARRVQLIAAGLAATTNYKGAGEVGEHGTAQNMPERIEAATALPTATPQGASAPAATPAAASIVAPSPDRPPTGGGSPAAGGGSNLRRKSASASAAGAEGLEGGGKVTPLRQGLGRRPRQDRKSASRANARSGGKGVAEVKIREALRSNPQISFDELVAATGVSRSTASKHYALWLQEQRTAQAAQ